MTYAIKGMVSWRSRESHPGILRLVVVTPECLHVIHRERSPRHFDILHTESIFFSNILFYFDLDWSTEEQCLEICFYPERDDDAAAPTRATTSGRKNRETLPTLVDCASR